MKYSKFMEIIGESVKSYGFVGKAVSTDGTRYSLNFVYCDEGNIVGTDGRRLHIVTLNENPWGFNDKKFYRLLKYTTKTVWYAELEEEPGSFPDWRKVIPEENPDKNIQYLSYTGKGYDRNPFYLEIAKIIRTLPEDKAINLNYLKDLPSGYSWEVSFYDKKSHVIFESGNMKAIIIPMDARD